MRAGRAGLHELNTTVSTTTVSILHRHILSPSTTTGSGMVMVKGCCGMQTTDGAVLLLHAGVTHDRGGGVGAGPGAQAGIHQRVVGAAVDLPQSAGIHLVQTLAYIHIYDTCIIHTYTLEYPRNICTLYCIHTTYRWFLAASSLPSQPQSSADPAPHPQRCMVSGTPPRRRPGRNPRGR